MIHIDPIVREGKTTFDEDGFFSSTTPDVVSHWVVEGIPDGKWKISIVVTEGIAYGYRIEIDEDGHE